MTRSPPLPWSAIDTVLLDMDGTLLDLRFDTVFWQEYLPERYAAHHEVDTEAARERIGELMRGAHPRLDYYCFEWWSRATGLDIGALKRRSLQRGLNPGMNRNFAHVIRIENRTPRSDHHRGHGMGVQVHEGKKHPFCIQYLLR